MLPQFNQNNLSESPKMLCFVLSFASISLFVFNWAGLKTKAIGVFRLWKSGKIRLALYKNLKIKLNSKIGEWAGVEIGGIWAGSQ